MEKSLESMLKKSFSENVEKSKSLTPTWKKGDKVRVLKSLDINTTNIKDYLGEVCTVMEVNKYIGIFTDPKIEYILELNGRLEPFFDEELDMRFKPKTKVKHLVKEREII